MAPLSQSVTLVLALAGAYTVASRQPGGPITFSGRLRHLKHLSGLYSVPKRPSSLYSTPDPPSGLYVPPKPHYNSHYLPPSPDSGPAKLRPVSGLSPSTPGRPDMARPSGGGGGSQFAETSATSVQKSSGEGRQTNQGEAKGVSVQQQGTGLGGNTQITDNQAFIQALQGSSGGGGGEQSSDNQININSNQLQQNVQGTLVNVNEGNMGIVVVNANGPDRTIVNQGLSNKVPVAKPRDGSFCRYACVRPLSDQLYCCDDGTNKDGPRTIHGGVCPQPRLLCTRNVFFPKCAHDGQCAKSDKCCYDECAQHHICKTADRVE